MQRRQSPGVIQHPLQIPRSEAGTAAVVVTITTAAAEAALAAHALATADAVCCTTHTASWFAERRLGQGRGRALAPYYWITRIQHDTINQLYAGRNYTSTSTLVR